MDKERLNYIQLILTHAKNHRSYMEYEWTFDLFSQLTYRLRYKKAPETEEERKEARYLMECNVEVVWEDLRAFLPADIVEEVTDFGRFFLGFGNKGTYKKLQTFFDKIKGEV